MLKDCEIIVLPRQEANFRENAEGKILTEFSLTYTNQHFTFIVCSDYTWKHFSDVMLKICLGCHVSVREDFNHSP